LVKQIEDLRRRAEQGSQQTQGEVQELELEKILSGVLGQTDGPEPRTGSIVVIDVPTGEILAMVSLPDYDLGSFSQDFPRLAADEKYLPLINRSVAARYPPGSTNKVLGALAALSCGAMTPATSFTCYGCLDPAKPNELRCLGTHGTISLQTAIQHSCNVYFYNVGRVAGLERFENFLEQLNYSRRPGCLLPEERPGLLPNPESAGRGEALQMGIGQGGLCVTPLHVANAMATIARGGQFLTPVIVRELADRQQRRTLNIPPSALAAVQEGMRLVVNSSGGTAYSTAYDDEIEISGKTGTAQTPPLRIDSNGNGRIDGGDEIVRQGDTAWFAGYAPSRQPRVAFAVVVEYTSEHGGRACGPLARHVVHACKKLGYLD
jgi:penicillin-binding protein 2